MLPLADDQRLKGVGVELQFPIAAQPFDGFQKDQIGRPGAEAGRIRCRKDEELAGFEMRRVHQGDGRDAARAVLTPEGISASSQYRGIAIRPATHEAGKERRRVAKGSRKSTVAIFSFRFGIAQQGPRGTILLNVRLPDKLLLLC